MSILDGITKAQASGKDTVKNVGIGGFAMFARVSDSTQFSCPVPVDVLEDGNNAPNPKKGAVTGLQPLIRPRGMVGSSSKSLSDMLSPDEEFFSKDERINILKSPDIVSGNIPVVNVLSGLLNTPQSTKGSAQTDVRQQVKAGTNKP